MEKGRERSFAPKWAAVVCMVTSAVACGGPEQEQTPGMMDDMPGMETAREPGTPMAGGDQMQVMQQMRTHMQQMSTVPGDSLVGVMPMHRQMASQMLAGMDPARMGSGMQMDSAWSATMDSVRSDLSRMEGMSGEELEEFMPAHRTRIQRLMSMHDSVMGMR